MALTASRYEPLARLVARNPQAFRRSPARKRSSPPAGSARGGNWVLDHDARCPPGVLGLAGELGALGPADVTPHAIENRQCAVCVV